MHFVKSLILVFLIPPITFLLHLGLLISPSKIIVSVKIPRTPIKILAGKALDLSPWYGKENDPAALVEATAFVMRAITDLLEQLRGEKRPVEIFDPHKSDLPRTGNFKKKR